MHRIVTLLACTTALAPKRVRTRTTALPATRVRTRVINDGEMLRRSAEVGPLVRAFSVGQRGRGSGVSTLNVAEASALQAATDELIAKRKKCDGSVIVAQNGRNLVGFALVNDDILETVAVAVDERGRGVGAQLVDAAGALASGAGNDELLVEVEPQNGRGRNFFEGLGFESTGERRGTLAVLSKPLPWRPPSLLVSAVVGLPLLVALAGFAASGDASQLDVEGALAALADRLPVDLNLF